MSKYSKSTGPTFTTQINNSEIGRGLRAHGNALSRDRAVKILEPKSVAKLFLQDPFLMLRQLISLIDKTIRKEPSILKHMSMEQYIHRSKIGDRLWTEIAPEYAKHLGQDSPEYQRLEDMWWAKIHPYAQHNVDTRNPEKDGNAKVIEEARKSATETSDARDFRGRWFNTFWQGDISRLDYDVIAKNILLHLLNEEKKIGLRDGQVQVREHPKSEIPTAPLATRRGQSIAKSVSDPRTKRTGKNFNYVEWSREQARDYFQPDIARQILSSVEETRQRYLEDKIGRSETSNKALSKLIGAALYAHFGKIVVGFEDRNEKELLWSIHNDTREFYKRILEGERIKIAMRSRSGDELAYVLPENKDRLISMVLGQRSNADMSQRVRTGRLLVHASDLPISKMKDGPSLVQRMDELILSDGQADIKRNESFTRVWRTSVGLSLRTLKGWADNEATNLIISDEGEQTDELKRKPPTDSATLEDLTTDAVARKAVQSVCDMHFREHAALLFGTRDYSKHGFSSRASIMTEADKCSREEVLWAFLALATAVRNRSNHFTSRYRLMRLFSGNVLESVSPGNANYPLSNRKLSQATETALPLLGKLLDFDELLQKHVIADEINKLKLGKYIERYQLDALVIQVSKATNSNDILAPKFMTLLRKAKALAQNDDVQVDDEITSFLPLDLDNIAKQKESANTTCIAILRQLYATGFRSWLTANGPQVAQVIKKVSAAKHERALAYQKGKKRIYQFSENLLDGLSDTEMADIVSFTAAISARSMADGKAVKNYRHDREAQRDRSNEVEALRQEIFAHLFAKYLHAAELDWLWSLEKREIEAEQLVTAENIALDHPKRAPWHEQFYAWLYLVPPDSIALLRHQLKKTEVLEQKAESETDEAFIEKMAEMDRLMGLYTKVQSAGFDGTEISANRELMAACFEDTDAIESVFSEAENETANSIPGTRRGLRQMIRFGHVKVLQPILSKHPVTNDELNRLMEIGAGATTDFRDNKVTLHTEIKTLWKDHKADKSILREKAKAYKTASVMAQRYSFDISAARLTEHARLHQLMMKIVGRLADYTLLWERDRIFVFLGMLYEEAQALDKDNQTQGTGGLNLIDCRDLDLNDDVRLKLEADPVVGLQLPSEISDRLRDAFHRGEGFDKKRVDDLTAALSEHGVIPMWSDEYGFRAKLFALYKQVLIGERRESFERWFETAAQEHQKDKSFRLKQQGSKQTKNLPTREPHYLLPKAQIRNDFAHYNVIGHQIKYSGPRVSGENPQTDVRNFTRAPSNRINHTYLVNAVRSLMAYDRKLKNAVSQSIAKIVEEDGLFITWSMKGDRLNDAFVAPKLVNHLDYVRSKETIDLQFALPAASVRYASMVQALFDFGSSGHRTSARGTGDSRKGPLEYPARSLWDAKEKVPEDMLYASPSLKKNHGKRNTKG
ncbi:MAG: hypothetical protein Rhims3KO_18270 [Hyphomicrobiales bacterium]